LAKDYLKRQGYKILTQNYRKKYGEIDIVAQQKNDLIFVEVKTCTQSEFGSPESWVTYRKQQQIGKMAASYIKEHRYRNFNCRFDVIAVRLGRKDSERIVHIKNAFWL